MFLFIDDSDFSTVLLTSCVHNRKVVDIRWRFQNPSCCQVHHLWQLTMQCHLRLPIRPVALSLNQFTSWLKCRDLGANLRPSIYFWRGGRGRENKHSSTWYGLCWLHHEQPN